MKTKLEKKQADYIAYLLKWMGGEKSQRMLNFESDIAELEKGEKKCQRLQDQTDGICPDCGKDHYEGKYV